MKTIIFFIFLLTFILSLPAQSEVFSYIDRDGVLQITDLRSKTPVNFPLKMDGAGSIVIDPLLRSKLYNLDERISVFEPFESRYTIDPKDILVIGIAPISFGSFRPITPPKSPPSRPEIGTLLRFADNNEKTREENRQRDAIEGQNSSLRSESQRLQSENMRLQRDNNRMQTESNRPDFMIEGPLGVINSRTGAFRPY